jgi:hypothetical protein
MDAYTCDIPIPPPSAVASAKVWIPSPKASFISCLREAGYHIMKGDDSLFVPFSELKTVLVNNGVAHGMSDPAIGRELSKLGLETVDRRVNGKVTKCRNSISMIDK